MSAASSSTEKPFELFELCAAFLMGVGAVGAAFSGFQGGLWGGAMTDAYAESGATNTRAASTYSDELANYIQDAQSDQRAKELLWVAFDTDNEDLRTRNIEVASWIYLSRLSEPAYAALKLPAATRKAFESEGDQVFSEAELKTSMELDLDETDAYEKALFAGSAETFKKSDEFLATARNANTIGDKFSLAGLIQTVGLFFAGLALVFKTRVRWAFLSVGTLVCGGGLGFMLTLPFA